LKTFFPIYHVIKRLLFARSFLVVVGAAAIMPSVAGAQATTAPRDAPRGAPRDTLALPALVVTATREPGALRTHVSTVTVLDASALREAGVTDLADGLRRVPGLAVMRQSSFGSPTSLFLRGGQANYVRVLIDGVPLNEPGGTLDLGRIPLDDVERVEVVRGPASVLYGSDAVTGVIQLFTRRGDSRRGVEAEVGGGSFGARHAALGASGMRDAGVLGGAEWSLRGDHHATDGVLAFNNAYRNDGLVATFGTRRRVHTDEGTDEGTDERADTRTGMRTDARLTARYNASQYQYPTESDGSVADRNAERTEHRLSLAADGGVRWSPRAETRVQLSLSELHPRTSDGPDDATDVSGYFGFFARATVTRHLADVRTTFRLGASQRLAVGAEYGRDAERGSSVSLSEFGDAPDEFRARRENVAAYTQWLGDAGRWSYSVGGRFDENSAFGSFRTARVGGAYRLAERLRVRASAGSAFKAPNFFENFAQGFTVGNPALRPEQSRSAEVGIEAEPGGGSTLKVTGFTQRFTDLVQYTGTPPSPGAPHYYNIAAANAGGVEVEAALPPFAGVRPVLAYTWTDTRVVDAGFSSAPNDNFVTGGRLLRRPRHMATLHLARTIGAPGGRGTVEATLTHVGEREDRDFATFPAGIVFLRAYTTVDVGAGFALPSIVPGDARAHVRVENVLGARYEAVRGFETPGRAFRVGLTLRR
jgi:vitamin B12 transporter